MTFRSLLLLAVALAGCAGRAPSTTVPTTGTFIDGLPPHGLAYLTIDTASLRARPRFADLVAPRVAEEADADRRLVEALLERTSSIGVVVLPPRDGHPVALARVQTRVGVADVEALLRGREGLRVERTSRDGRDALLLAGSTVSLGIVACGDDVLLVGAGLDVASACEGTGDAAPSPAFARLVDAHGHASAPEVVYALDVPCGTPVIEPFLRREPADDPKPEAPSDVRAGVCATSLALAFGDGLRAVGEVVLEDALRFDDLRDAVGGALTLLGERYRDALAGLRAALARTPRDATLRFDVAFSAVEVDDMIAFRDAALRAVRAPAGTDVGIDATTPARDVLAALDARLASFAAPPRDRIARTDETPKGLLVYLPDAEEPLDEVPPSVRALAQATGLDVLAVEPTLRLATDGAVWTESYPRDLARIEDAIARAARDGLVGDASRHVLVGRGQGGAIALEIALRRPTEVAAVIAVEPRSLGALPLLEDLRRAPSGVGVAVVRVGDRPASSPYVARLEALRVVTLTDVIVGDVRARVQAFDGVRAVVPDRRGTRRSGGAAVGIGCEARGADGCREAIGRATTALALGVAHARACRAGVVASCADDRVRHAYQAPGIVDDDATARFYAYQHCLGGVEGPCRLTGDPAERFLARLTLGHLRCERGDGAGCEVVSAGLAGRAVDDPAIEARLRDYARRGCEAGDAGGCLRVAQGATGDAALGAAREACGLASTDGCLVLARALTDASSVTDADVELLSRACFDAGRGRVCGALAIVWAKHGREVPGDVLEDALDAACGALDALACYTLGVRHQREGEGDAAESLFEVACRGEEPRACLALADARRGADPAAARALEATACTQGHPEACRRFTAAVRRDDAGIDDEMARVLGHACDADVRDACARASTIAGDPLDAIRFARRACKLGDDASCARARSLYEGLSTGASIDGGTGGNTSG